MLCWSNSGSVSVFLNFWLIFCPCPLIFKQNEFILFWENLNSAGDQIISSLYSQIWSYCIQRLNESPSFAKCLWAIRRIFLFPQSLVVPEVDATALTRWHEHVWDGAPGEEQTARNQAASQWFKSSEPGGRPHSHESPLSLPLGHGRTHTHAHAHGFFIEIEPELFSMSGDRAGLIYEKQDKFTLHLSFSWCSQSVCNYLPIYRRSRWLHTQDLWPTSRRSVHNKTPFSPPNVSKLRWSQTFSDSIQGIWQCGS